MNRRKILIESFNPVLKGKKERREIRKNKTEYSIMRWLLKHKQTSVMKHYPFSFEELESYAMKCGYSTDILR